MSDVAAPIGRIRFESFESDRRDPLVERALLGSPDAVEGLWKTHQPRAFRYALQLCRSHDVAADLVSEGFAKAIARLPSFRGNCSFSTWLCGIIRNGYIDGNRKAKRFPTVELTSAFEGGHSASAPAEGGIAAETFGRQADRLLLDRAIAKLPPAQKACVELYYFESMSVEEIARCTGVGSATIKTRLHRARHLLRKELWFLEDSEP